MPYTSEDIFRDNDGAQGLGRLRPVALIHSAADVSEYMPTIGLFGTAGNPQEVYNWRAAAIPRIEDEIASRGLSRLVTIFNPQKDEWRPEDAAIESAHLARDGSLVLPILDITTGHASLAETGFAALSGTLRPQKVNMFIESGIEHGDAVLRARALTKLLATKTLNDFPINASLSKSLEEMIAAGIDDITNFANSLTSRVRKEVHYTIEQRTDLAPQIALVGSGADRYSDSWYEGMRNLLVRYDVAPSEQFSSYAKSWTLENAQVELEHKTNDAVVLFVVTEDQNSFGAMGELGWLMTYCVLNGQRLGIYVEQHDSEPKSDQNRQRKLAMSHLGRHLLDFPDLPVFIASSPAELARYGASELAKYKQIQRSVGNVQ